MNHFTTEEWIDFVNQVIPVGKGNDMQRHLEIGCKSCQGALDLWSKVRKAGAAEVAYQPPAASVHLAKSAFAEARGASSSSQAARFIEVLFDSFRQPALVGARSARTGIRQMLYRADPYQVDIQIEAKPGENRLMVTGQLLNVSRPDVVESEVQVMLSNRRGSVTCTMTNQFGEFEGEIDNSEDVEISFPCPGQKPVVISLRNALDRLSGERS